MSAGAAIRETAVNQRLAADPFLSAFVSANAGSGKTRVLTNRVARLLLAGAEPSTILCITFTKAAAAEMSDRLFKLLGQWALAGDAELQKALVELDGDERIRSADNLARARRLFARALETPGGLKIQTIHSFCESVLKRFPLEAGVPPGFAVIEEAEADELSEEAIAIAARDKDAGVNAAFRHLLQKMSGDQLRDMLAGAFAKRRKFARATSVGWAPLGDEVADVLGVGKSDSAAALTASLLRGIDDARLKRMLEVCEEVGGQQKKYFSQPLHHYFSAATDLDRLSALTGLFLTGKGEARKSFATGATKALDPGLEEFMQGAQAQFIRALGKIRAAEAVEDTRAFFTLVERCFATYAKLKAERAALDFDDLIAHTRALFQSDGGAQWVLYKLDMGLAHILLDEAQDTGPDAWEVIEGPLDEFFSGAGARDEIRTFFAVGDQKQSIYSFQGADAALFAEKEQDLGKKIAAAQRFENVPLKASFRTAAPVLRFVDALFRRDDVVENVSASALLHTCTREGHAGLVELWPLVTRSPAAPPDPWDAPLDSTPAESPAKILSKEVAQLIAGWLASGETLSSQGRAVEPGDILILVQSRAPRSKSGLFTQVIRELAKAGVPVAGADRIRLMEDQGVLDLVSYARAVLLTADDLSLAETLRSPFFNFSEDGLYGLAAGRAQPRLWDALKARRRERPDWDAAFTEISAARGVAMEEGAAAFFTHILERGASSGWKRLAERLGAPSREPLEEFLRLAHEFELRRPRSLRLFLDKVAQSGAMISREMSEAGQFVRVMTAHKAKGLEANIVFLIDAHRPANTGKIGSILTIDGPDGADIPALALAGARSIETLSAAAEREKRLIRDEYRRLLYVAATRARDRLYVCGCERGNYDPHKPTSAEKSWHALAEDAFAGLGDDVIEAGERFGGKVRRLQSAQTAPVAKSTQSPKAIEDVFLDPALFRSAPAETRAFRLSPSQLIAAHAPDPAFSPLQGDAPFIRGRILHKLLQHLPMIAAPERRKSADRLLSHYANAFGESALAEMREEAMTVLEDVRFAEVFAPGGMAEVAIGGRPAGAREGLVLSGQIDRLAFCGDRILIVDYKTNRPPPLKIEDAPLSYIAQMAAYRALLQEIYPARKIEAALLWTYEARLMPIPEDALDRARALTLA